VSLSLILKLLVFIITYSTKFDKKVCILCRLDQQVSSHTKRFSLLYITQSNRSSNVRLSLLYGSGITDIINRVKIAQDVLFKLKLQSFFFFFLVQMSLHTQLMYHHLLTHGDGSWYVKRNPCFFCTYC